MIKNNSILFPCSFCGKVEGDCEIIVIGPTVNICNECVEVAQSEVVKIRAMRNGTPPPGEFSGCRCTNCPERNGAGECSCCADRRAEELFETSLGDDEISLETAYLLFGPDDAFDNSLQKNNMKNIEQAIQESQYIPDLKENWDDDGAKPITHETYIRAINILRDINNVFLAKRSCEVPVPNIAPCPNGSIDICWKSDVHLLINISECGLIDFFGHTDDSSSPNETIKGKSRKSISFLGYWLSDSIGQPK